MKPRCEWCGVFVAKNRKPSAWRVRVGKQSRQNPRSPYNYWSRLLCPSCTPANVGSWRVVTVAEVQRRWLNGWDGLRR